MNEFELIDRFFKRSHSRADVLVGSGDDAALVSADPSAAVIVTLASLSAAPGETPDGAGFARALARTALNRLAAQGAAPAWFTLGLTLEKVDSDWLGAFSAALFSAIELHGAELIGGDTTRGPLTATLFGHGTMSSPARQISASPRVGDAVFVTGDLGRASIENDPNGLSDPRPARVNESRAAWPFTSAAGDLRESLAATVLRLVGPYGLGAEIESVLLPVSAAGAEHFRRPGGARLLVDASADPELCFIVVADDEAAFNDAMAGFESRCTRIGSVVKHNGVHLR